MSQQSVSNTPDPSFSSDRLQRTAQQAWSLLKSVVGWLLRQFWLFLTALPLFAVWLAFGIFLFWLARQPQFIDFLQVQPPVALLASLVTTLVGFGIQQWKYLSEQEQNQHARREEARKEILALQKLLKNELSEGIHSYYEYQQKFDPIWQDDQVRNSLRRVWENSTAPWVRQAFDLWRVFDTNAQGWTSKLEKMGQKGSIQSLEQAYEILDGDWKTRFALMLMDLGHRTEYQKSVSGDILQKIEARTWKAIVQHCLLMNREIGSLVEFSGRPPVVRVDVNARVNECLLAPKSVIFWGKPDSGKTAHSLFLIQQAVNNRIAFPVYYPEIPLDPSSVTQLDGLLKTFAQTLLYYLVVDPESFTKHIPANRAKIAHVLGRYFGAGSNLALRLQEVGFAPFGTGGLVLKELGLVLQGTELDKSANENDLLSLIAITRPKGFQNTFILLDLPDELPNDALVANCLKTLFAHTQSLARAGVFFKVFLPERLRPYLIGISLPEQEDLEWSDRELLNLLDRRLAQYGNDTLEDWFETAALRTDPRKRLVEKAQGSPGRLDAFFAQLHARQATPKKRSITAQDLDEVLGPVPPTGAQP